MSLPPLTRRSAASVLAVGATMGAAGLAWWTTLQRSAPGTPTATDQTALDDSGVRQAAALAGVRPDQIRRSTGGVHLVYHSISPLPSASQPRVDGRLTLVWFSAPW